MLLSILIPLFPVLLFYYYKKHCKTMRKYKMPNGPSGTSMYKSLFQVLSKPHLQFSKWANKYGKVYTINILGTPALLVNDAKAMRQVFGSIESTGKFRIAAFDKLSEGTNGVLSAEGEVWHEVRMFTMKILRECGISKSSVVEPAVWQSCEEIMKWFENASKNSEVVYSLRGKFIDAIGNVVWNIATRSGEQCNKSGMGDLVLEIIDALQITTKSGLLFLPWLKHVAPEWSGYNQLSKACSGLHAGVDKYFEERKIYRKQVKVEPEDSNLLDAYLDQWENCKDPKSSFYGEAGWKHCFYSMVQFVLGGGETTATTLNWIINYLVACPNVQQKLYEEVKTALGDETPVLWEAKRMPYMEAVIYETLRMSSLVPLGTIHRLLDNIKYEDYLIPKGTLLIANIYHVHNDQGVWKDPENFRPERFLDVDEAMKNKLKQNVVAFQAGKRICPGEGLSRDVLFLVTARLVQKFQFLPVPDKSARDYIEPEAGYMLLPKQIGVRVKARV